MADSLKKIHIELEGFNWKFALRGVAAVAMGIALGYFLGLPIIIGLSALFVSLADSPGCLRARLMAMGIFTLLGTVLTLVAMTIGGAMWPVAISLTVVTFLCGLALKYSLRTAFLALLLNTWYAIALSIYGSPVLDNTLGFLIGGLLAMMAVSLYSVLHTYWRGDRIDPSDAKESVEPPNQPLTWESPVLQFAVIKAFAVGLAAVIGWMLIGGDPFWVVFAPLAIVKPDLHQTKKSGLERIAGTILGGIIGMILISYIQDPLVLVVLFVVIVFLLLGLANINYAIFVAIVTVVLVIGGKLEGISAIFTGLERIIATILGVLIAFAVIVLIGRLIWGRVTHAD